MTAVSEGETTDAELVRHARSGDRSAFGELVLRHQDRVYGYLLRTLGSAADAQDVTQTTFLLAWRKLDQFRGEAKLTTWLTQIAVNQAASLRRKKRPKAQLNTEDHRVSAADASAERPSARLETADRDRLVQEALGRLSPEHREVLVLKEFQDHDYKEISDLVGCPVGTVRSRLHRARCELASLLAPHRESLLVGTG